MTGLRSHGVIRRGGLSLAACVVRSRTSAALAQLRLVQGHRQISWLTRAFPGHYPAVNPSGKQYSIDEKRGKCHCEEPEATKQSRNSFISGSARLLRYPFPH